MKPAGAIDHHDRPPPSLLSSRGTHAVGGRQTARHREGECRRTTAGGQHYAFLRCEVANNISFALTKTRFTLYLEDPRYGRSCARLDFVIGIDKTLIQALSQRTAYGRFTRTHKTD